MAPQTHLNHFGCARMRNLHHGWAANKSAATAQRFHNNTDQNLWGKIPAPSWIYDMKNEGISESKTEVQPDFTRVYLKKVASMYVELSVGADCVKTVCTAGINMLSRTVVRDCASFGTQLFKQTSFCGLTQTQTSNSEALCCHEQASADFKHYCH